MGPDGTTRVARPPPGMHASQVVASALNGTLRLDLRDLLPLTVVLTVEPEQVAGRLLEIGVVDAAPPDLQRGVLGAALTAMDLEMVQLTPLRSFLEGELIAWQDDNGAVLRYGEVASITTDKALDSVMRLLVKRGTGNTPLSLLSSEVYSFDHARQGSPRKAAHEELMAEDIAGIGGVISEAAAAAVGNATDADGGCMEDEAHAAVRGADVVSAVKSLLQRLKVPLDLETTALLEENIELKSQVGRSGERISVLQASTVALEEEVERYKMSMICPITQALMTDPVILSDGHSYERTAIEQWLRTSNKSPMTGAELPTRVLITNHTLRSIIKDHQ